MWLVLLRGSDYGNIGEGQVEDLRWEPKQKKKRLFLKPGEKYVLCLYNSLDHSDLAWTPEHQEGVLVHESSQNQKEQLVPDPPQKHSLHLKLIFQVTNDGVLPYILRWRFACKKKDGRVNFWHLPLHVSVSRWKVRVTAFSLGIAPMIGLTYERALAHFSGEKGLTSFVPWLLKAFVVSLGTMVICFCLLHLFYKFWNRGDID